MHKTIPLTVNGTSLVFTMTPDIFDRYFDELQPHKKKAPARNLLMRSVRPECKDALRAAMETPGLTLTLAGTLLDAYAPEVDIVVGESSDGSAD